ncbi:Anaphase-promoting complex subunit 11 [Aphelenchoides fujianensis]|nr:Anaphase-promoting complex subunit 11 [Aphelenchoides fujianensis]KAI6239873.1 Anaphase-promoting complex subunit 11 [Aphelenchoides fujianensis]
MTPTSSRKPKRRSIVVKPVELPTETSLQLTIKQVQLTGEWRWRESREDKCGICHSPFEGCCVDCRMPGDPCPMVVGTCSHAFHMHCIYKWTNSQSAHSKPACPLCRQEWRMPQ